jgi:hypothetical protein
MYKKILGLKQLERMSFPYPPYQVIDITEDRPEDVKEYVLRKIRQIGIPFLREDRIGVTVRVSMPGDLDKLAKHGGLHVIDEGEILKRVLAKYEQYKPEGKIVIQHTVDAKCSGAILKEKEHVTIEAILGDAPPLLEGRVTSYEKWVFNFKSRRWKKEEAYMCGDEELTVLTPDDIQKLEVYVGRLPSDSYLEWSISKSGKLYFYEYCKLKNQMH